MVEFKEDVRTGMPYLMEINGRFWGSLQLAIDAGVDFPLLLQHAFGSASSARALPKTPPDYKVGVQSRWLLGDLDHLIALVKRPSLASDAGLSPGRLRALGRFLRPCGRRSKFEVARASDLRPFLREVGDWIANVLS
jgi:hypothetical protein